MNAKQAREIAAPIAAEVTKNILRDIYQQIERVAKTGRFKYEYEVGGVANMPHIISALRDDRYFVNTRESNILDIRW